MARLGVLSRFAWVLLLTSLFVSRADNHCSADATRAVARHLARGSVKLTPAEPLLFLHVPKTAGSTLQRLLHLGLLDTIDAPDRLLIMDSSCKLSLDGLARAGPLMSWARPKPCSGCRACLSCAQHLEQVACATAFLGHFRPVKLFSTLRDVDDRLTNATGAVCRRAWSDWWPVTDGGAPSAAAAELYAQRHAALLRRSLCIVVFREPVDRAISHYYEFIAASGTGKGRSELSAPEFLARHGAQAFANATSGNLQTKWLGGARLAKAAVDHCVVGVQERFDDMLAMLARFLPVPSSSAGLPRAHTNPHHGMTDAALAQMRAELAPLLKEDTQLYERARCAAMQQVAFARRAAHERNASAPTSRC